MKIFFFTDLLMNLGTLGCIVGYVNLIIGVSVLKESINLGKIMRVLGCLA